MQRINRIACVIEPLKTVLLERPVRAPDADEVLIRIMASAICGSDLHIFRGRHPSAPLPVTIGHEFSGVVIEIGRDVENVAVGDRVTLEPVITCGHCPACEAGDYGYCENISFTYRQGDGSMADYITIPAKRVYKIPDEMSFEEGALIEPLSVAVHAVRRADIELGETVLVIGGGAVGILIAGLCKLRGAKKIILSDPNEFRLELSRKFGVTHTILARKEDVDVHIRELTEGRGVDKSFECVGSQTTLHQAMNSLKKNGLATVVGIFEDTEVTVPVTRFVTHEIKVQGAQGYCRDFPIALGLASLVPLEKLITQKFTLDRIQDALELIINKTENSMKVVIRAEDKEYV